MLTYLTWSINRLFAWKRSPMSTSADRTTNVRWGSGGGIQTHFDAFKLLKTHLVATDSQHFWGSLNQQFATRKIPHPVWLFTPSLQLSPGSIRLPPVSWRPCCRKIVISCPSQWRNNGVGRVGKVQGAPKCKGPPSSKQKIIITVKCRHNYSHYRMFRCSIAAASTDKLQYKFKFYSYVMSNCVDDKNDNEEGRAPLEYLPRGPRVSSYATGPSPSLLFDRRRPCV